jgi:DNA gyrase/topoisomerase IV subunit B
MTTTTSASASKMTTTTTTTASKTSSSKKTIEETYKKLSQREHVLQRPGMYIGSVGKTIEELWVKASASENTNENSDENSIMIKKMIEYSPGFIKIFDEILTNALDHSTRDPNLNFIKVSYSQETGEICVLNNGSGIPVVEHKEHKMYVPELIFGHFLTGSNYDDKQKRIGAGLNGVGSNCTNVFSKKFIVETVDSDNQLKFVQEFSDNMLNKTKPKITKNTGKSYTKITFIPDYTKFNMKGLEDDAVLLINKRVYDCIACTREDVQIYLNGERLKGRGLVDYANYFFKKDPETNRPIVKMFHEKFVQRVGNNDLVWEYIVVPSDKYEQVSFVNGNSTFLGGKHVDHIVYQITAKLKSLLETKKKLKDVKPAIIRERLFLFLRATVINPTFSSQTKEQLTTQTKDFGCKIEVPDKFIDKLWKSQIVDEIVEFSKIKESIELGKKTDGAKKNKIYIPKLEDALWAGTAKSDSCTLILTEGDSAKTFAMWGRSVVGPERYACFPLKGKCISEYTRVPLWNGEIKYAKDIKIGDELIGDDGDKRTVLTLFKDNGKMYEVHQDRGDVYKVNDEHILTLCMPEHKSIHWAKNVREWIGKYWDKSSKSIKTKIVFAKTDKLKCDECEQIFSGIKTLKKHYQRRHKNIPFPSIQMPEVDSNDENVVKARKKLEEILSTIDDNNIIDISIKDYLALPKSHQRKLKGLRGECVNWEEKEVLLDPYVLGLWLGDGCSNGYAYACDGKTDYEIMDYLNEWGKNNDAQFTKSSFNKYCYHISSIDNFRIGGYAPLKKVLSQYDLINNKHIPKEYLINSREVRLKLLAGLIDTDGYVHHDGTIEIMQTYKHKQLIDDIVYLARSLGLYTYLTKRTVGYSVNNDKKYTEAYRIKISGYTENIPTLLPRKKCKSTQMYNMRNSTGIIKIKEIEDDNYVGIGIDKNQRFLINDFTVTHNCLNVRDASISQLMNNEELNNIKQILGLKQNHEYISTKDLRYGKVILLTDADTDGLKMWP